VLRRELNFLLTARYGVERNDRVILSRTDILYRISVCALLRPKILIGGVLDDRRHRAEPKSIASSGVFMKLSYSAVKTPVPL